MDWERGFGRTLELGASCSVFDCGQVSVTARQSILRFPHLNSDYCVSVFCPITLVVYTFIWILYKFCTASLACNVTHILNDLWNENLFKKLFVTHSSVGSHILLEQIIITWKVNCLSFFGALELLYIRVTRYIM